MSKEQLIDLDKKQLGLLKEIIKQHIPNKTVWAYGSRISWKANERSDLDLVVFDCDATEIIELREAFEESDLLISVDVMDWENIPENFKENIKEKCVVLQEKTELPGWRKVKLGEIMIFQRGHDLPKSKMKVGNIPVAGSNGIIGYHDTATTKAPGITIGRSGNIGTPQFYESDFWAHNTTLYIKDFLGNNEKFIFYILKTLPLSGFNSGSAVPTLNRNYIHELKIICPPLPEQKAIAEVLSSLDDKIDLLHRQNKTLEDMAQTLFRQWFVEEADDGWEEIKLGDIVENFDSKRIPVSKMQRDKMKKGELYPYYGAAQIMDYVNNYIFSGEYVLMAEDGTVRTPEGYPVLQYARGKFWVNNHTHVLKAKPPYTNHFIWHLLLKFNIENIISGAVQPKINQQNLNSIKFPKPPLDLIQRFQVTLEAHFKKQKNNQSQIYTMENLRDTLLPKLMNGNVSVVKSS